MLSLCEGEKEISVELFAQARIFYIAITHICDYPVNHLVVS